jgi:hypothetical protein
MSRARTSFGEDIVAVLVNAVFAFVLLVPVVYVLLMALRATLALAGLARYGDPDAFMVTGTGGVLVGSALICLLTARGTLKTAADREAPSSEWDEIFVRGLWIRVPFALLIAAIPGVPETTPARIVVGVFWGVVMAVCALLHNAYVDRKPAPRALFHVVFAEVLLGFVLLVGVMEGLRDRTVLRETLETVPAAAVACMLTYLVARAVSRVRTIR